MKTVLITGASRGIGAEIARTFSSHGYHTILTCSKSMEDLDQLKQELEENYHVPCTTVLCDMGIYEDVEKLFHVIPPVDVLINNAGISYFGLLSEMSVEEWQHLMNTNLNACFYTCKLAIPGMVHKKDGCILNISSVWGNVGASLETAYSASKGGINALTKALAKELAPSHIRVNAIAPGVIETEMNNCLSPEDRSALIEEIPADRFGSAKEVAQLAWQIINAPSYMTGQIISIDGGWQ